MAGVEEKTFVAIKPDAVKRGLIGKIIERIELKGYKIVAMKMLHPDEELAAKHYAEHVGKPFYESLIKFITSGPIVAMVVQGENAIAGMRQIMGKTRPEEADVGTIRADFAQVKDMNVIHGSDCADSAKREIDIYFKPEELCLDWKNMYEVVMETSEF
ncbi:nucleoside-diphosphate kinase [bacterium]|nr:nucleoside-diphosphate kinase [bacterium]